MTNHRTNHLSKRGVYERKVTEEDVILQIRHLLELNGARVHRVVERIPWGRRKSEPGIPDIFGWWPGLCDKRETDCPGNAVQFFIEAKRPGGKHRPAQTAWIESARRDGVIAFFADSVESVVAGFKEFGIQIKGLP